MATRRSGKERHSSSSSSSSSSPSSSSSLLNISSNSLTKSINGPVQYHSNRSKGNAAASSKRSVTPTPNSRAQRSVTPNSNSRGRNTNNSGSENESLKVNRPVTPLLRANSIVKHDPEPGRVRVAVRLRPKVDEDIATDADFIDCIEIQPELKKLKLKKNNWSSESYRFDEVFAESASQKRVYEVVAKPVVESVFSGYNGTIMAYGQTGTGKTYTVGNLGKTDASERGIIVRAVEDIIANTSLDNESVEVSYLQMYKETMQDLLAPEKVNIPIVEDVKTGEVLLPGASVIRIRDLDHFMELLECGEANRHAANTKLNISSSRSHAILMISVKKAVVRNAGPDKCLNDKVIGADSHIDMGIKMIRKGKLLIVDLAGSERIDKSGSEGQLLEEAKFINLSLTALGKCINALAENSPHIPTRESKLTRILRDSFGGCISYLSFFAFSSHIQDFHLVL